MVGFFDFKKKQQASGPADAGQVSYQQETYTTTTSQSSPQYVSGGQSYNGIGSPPQPQMPQYDQQPQTVTRTTVTSGNMQPNQQYPQPMNGAQQDSSQVSVSQTNGAAGKNVAVGVQNTQANGQSQSALLNSNINQQKRGELDVMTHLTQRSNRVFMAANNKARELHNSFLDSEHLLHGLLTDGEIYKLFVELKVQPQLIEDTLAKIYKKESNAKPPQVAPRVKRIIDNSLLTARKLGFEFISPEHILLSLYDEKEGVGAKILVKLGVKKEDLNKKILGKKEGLEKTKAQDGGKKSLMEQFTIDLTEKAAQGLLDPVVERSVEIERVIHILSRRTKNNPALVGEAGVGKTAIVEGLAEKIVAKQVPESLLEKRILQLDLMGILAGASHRGEFEERMKNLIEDIRNSQGRIIMFIDEIHTIVGAGGGGEGSADVANFIKPAMARGDLQLIGATTLTEYRKYIEKDPALERRFQPVLVPEPTEEAAIKMVKALRNKYEAFHRVKIPDDAVEAAVKFSKRYVGERFLPDKAVDLIDEAASAVRLPLISLPEVMKSLQDRISQLTQEMQEAEKAKDRVKARILKSKIDDIQGDLKDKKEEYDITKAQTTSAVSIEMIKDVA
jgi:ATP-dependent Clp protease ATP-binding subunit ClpC